MAVELPVNVVPMIDEQALRVAVVEAIRGHAVVAAGETLVIRVRDWTTQQVLVYQDYLNAQELPFRVLVVMGDELAVARPEAPAPGSQVSFAGGMPEPQAVEDVLAKAVARFAPPRRSTRTPD